MAHERFLLLGVSARALTVFSVMIALGGKPYSAVRAVAKASLKDILRIFAPTKQKRPMPTTPMTMSSIIGTMMLSSISGVHMFRPSKTYIIRANMTIP